MKDMGKVIGVLRAKYAGQMDFGMRNVPDDFLLNIYKCKTGFHSCD